MKRTCLQNRSLPYYTRAEETLNMVTHITGGGIALIGSVFCIGIAGRLETLDLIGALIYCIAMVGVYTMSSIYHGLRAETAKKVMQVIDHCAIYFLIAGTYTPILVTGFLPLFPKIGWGLLLLQWGLTSIAVTLTAIDLHNYRVFSMICYIFMGWSILFFLPQAMVVMTPPGFYWLLAGGIAYTVGAVLFGLGSKLRWMHGIFHIFVILGSFCQYLAIVLYLY